MSETKRELVRNDDRYGITGPHGNGEGNAD